MFRRLLIFVVISFLLTPNIWAEQIEKESITSSSDQEGALKAIICGSMLLIIAITSVIYYKYRIALTPEYEYRPFLWGLWQRRVVIRYVEGIPSLSVGRTVMVLGILGFVLGAALLTLGLLRLGFTINIVLITH